MLLHNRVGERSEGQRTKPTGVSAEFRLWRIACAYSARVCVYSTNRYGIMHSREWIAVDATNTVIKVILRPLDKTLERLKTQNYNIV